MNKPEREHRAKLAVLAYNSTRTWDESYARLPILATDCDYEIVRRSGVQGMKINRENDNA